MREVLKATAVALGIALVWFGPTGFVLWESRNQIEFWHGLYEYHKKRDNYLFDGANNRGLLDICVGPAGDEGIFFKEDCRT